MQNCPAQRTAVIRPRTLVWIAALGALIGSPVYAQNASVATPAGETTAPASADPLGITEPVPDAAPIRTVPVVDAQPMRAKPAAAADGDVLPAEFKGLTAAAAHDVALEAALHQASLPGNPNATVVWDESPETAHAVGSHDKRGHAVQVGEASWYGADFAGLPTASGEIYDMYAYTVAHPSWPLGSIVRIENLKNGRLVLARVNDRGPYAFNRILDCSMSIAQSLGFIHSGHTRVRLTLLDSAPDAWTRFEGFRAPMIALQTRTRTPRPETVTQSEAMMALAEDTAPPLPPAPPWTVAAVEPAAEPQPLITFRAASVLPYPAIAHAWDSLSRWLLGPAGESTRWHRIERSVDRFGLRGFVRLFTRL